jgi:predicted dehydrogenase
VSAVTATRPRLGFLGVGWIGRQRLEAVATSGAAEVVGVADSLLGPLLSLDELLELELDGVVIATPSALHAEQSVAALERGLAVFCQKPLARTAAEAGMVVEAARQADRLLGVDLSYRYLEGARLARELVRSGQLGDVFAAELVFHNGYGPDKAWCYDPRLSGGGCVVDLGIHLVDLALWVLSFPPARVASSRLHAGGRPWSPHEVEDYAVAQLDLDGGCVARVACSWGLHAGCDAVIEASFLGTEGAVSVRNVGGSFFDFRTVLKRGTTEEVLAAPPEAWGGRALLAWTARLARDRGFDPAAEEAVRVAELLDRIYGR